MSISFDVGSDGFSIKITGDFDYTLHEDFRGVMDSAESSGSGKYTVDLSGVDEMDSSALGMLLLLRDKCGSEGREIDVLGCKPEIYALFKTANFDNYFNFI